MGISLATKGVSFTVEVGIGSPPTMYKLLVDTGGANTWIGAGKPYVKTSTSKDTGNKVSIKYNNGEFSGTQYTDQITISPELVIDNQSIGVASAATGFNDVDGVLGLGPVDLTSGTVANTDSVPTITDNLFGQETISTESVGISHVPTTDPTEVGNVELDFGGVDTAKITSDITYVPITSTQPANHYWGLDISVTYGDQEILNSAGIVDSCTTTILLAADAFKAYQSATGAELDTKTELLKITEDQYNNLQPLVFNIGGTSFELSPNAQIFPRSLNKEIGGDTDGIYLIIGDLGSPSGEGLDFILGIPFMQRFYTVLDTTNNQIGFATTPYTDATSN
ncbi:acid protease [Ramicandelaber brevisporus]|nr:acid protease [Ramicandelaber brevisporus]